MNDTKKFPIILTSEFHKQIKEAAAKKHLSMSKYFVQAVIEKLGRDGKNENL